MLLLSHLGTASKAVVFSYPPYPQNEGRQNRTATGTKPSILSALGFPFPYTLLCSRWDLDPGAQFEKLRDLAGLSYRS
jgi:hypothetical protein